MYTCGRFTVMYSRNQQLSSDKKFKYIDIKNGGGETLPRVLASFCTFRIGGT